MYKSLRKILLVISTIILTVTLAACGEKSKPESQPKPLTSQEVIEKYSEAVKNVKSFKFTSDLTSKTTSNNPQTSSILGENGLESSFSKDGILSTEPFSILVNHTMTLSGTSLKISNYINESNELYIKSGKDAWKKTKSNKSQSEKIDVVKVLIYDEKFLESLKNVAGDLKLEEQGDNYVLSYNGTDEKFIPVLTQFDSSSKSLTNNLTNVILKNLDFKIIVKKSSFEPIEISFNFESTKSTSSSLTTKTIAKRTFSEINTAKVTKPEGIQ